MIRQLREAVLLAIVLVGTTASVAMAEVMDKEPSIAGIWAWCIVSALIGFFFCRFSPWFLPLTLCAGLLLPAYVHLELLDPFVGPAIIREAGTVYPIHNRVGAGIVVAANALGVYFALVRSGLLPQLWGAAAQPGAAADREPRG